MYIFNTNAVEKHSKLSSIAINVATKSSKLWILKVKNKWQFINNGLVNLYVILVMCEIQKFEFKFEAKFNFRWNLFLKFWTFSVLSIGP